MRRMSVPVSYRLVVARHPKIHCILQQGTSIFCFSLSNFIPAPFCFAVAQDPKALQLLSVCTSTPSFILIVFRFAKNTIIVHYPLSIIFPQRCGAARQYQTRGCHRQADLLRRHFPLEFLPHSHPQQVGHSRRGQARRVGIQSHKKGPL